MHGAQDFKAGNMGFTRCKDRNTAETFVPRWLLFGTRG
jgi:hypothetical protein